MLSPKKKYSTLQQEPDSGNDAPRHRRPATLPIKNLFNPVLPLVPMTIRSVLLFAASAMDETSATISVVIMIDIFTYS